MIVQYIILLQLWPGVSCFSPLGRWRTRSMQSPTQSPEGSRPLSRERRSLSEPYSATPTLLYRLGSLSGSSASLFSGELLSSAPSTPLLSRKRVNSASLFDDPSIADSPLKDLAPLAVSGLTSRVSRNASFSFSLDRVGDAFDADMDNEDTVFTVEGGDTHALARAALVACLCSLQFGLNNGNMNTPSAAMRADLGLQTNDSLWGLCVSIFCAGASRRTRRIVSIFVTGCCTYTRLNMCLTPLLAPSHCSLLMHPIGALIGCSGGACVANRTGRKSALLLTSAIFAVGTIIELVSGLVGCSHPTCGIQEGVLLMLVGRVVTGVACGATTVVVPIYLGEISPPHLRGVLGTLFQLVCVAAMLIAQVVGLPSLMGRPGVWPLYLSLGLLPAAGQFLLTPHLPESPRWLAAQPDTRAQEEAAQALALLRGLDESDLAVRCCQYDASNGPSCAI